MSEHVSSVSLISLMGYFGLSLLANEAVFRFLKLKRRKKKTESVVKDLVYVYQYRRPPQIPSLSASCLALETWLRIARINYENVEFNPWHRSSTGALPFIEVDGVERSNKINEILVWLTNRFQVTYAKVDVDSTIAAKIENIAENLLWCNNYFRYVEHKHQLLHEKFVGDGLMAPLCSVLLIREMFNRCIESDYSDMDESLAESVAKFVKEKLLEMGFPKDFKTLDFLRHGNTHMKTLSDILGAKQYLLGDKPSPTDCIVFGVAAQILYLSYETQLKATLHSSCLNLANYCHRIKNQFWPDWDAILKTGHMNTQNENNKDNESENNAAHDNEVEDAEIENNEDNNN